MANLDFTSSIQQTPVSSYMEAMRQRQDAETQIKNQEIAKSTRLLASIDAISKTVSGVTDSLLEAKKQRNMKELLSVMAKGKTPSQQAAIMVDPASAVKDQNALTFAKPDGMNNQAEARKTGMRDILVKNADGTQSNRTIGFDAQGAYNPLNPSQRLSANPTQEELESLPERSYAMQPVTDAEGNVTFVPKSRTGKVNTGGVSVPENERGKIKDINLLPVKQATDANLRLKDAMEDPVIKNAKNTAVTISNVEKLLAADNKVAIDRLGGLTQKLVALDSGNLAAWEQRDPNSRAYVSRLKQLYTMSTEGKLTPEIKTEMLDLLKITKENLLQNMNDASNQRLDALVETYPRLNKEAMRKKLGLETYQNRLNPPVDQSAAKAALRKKLGL